MTLTHAASREYSLVLGIFSSCPPPPPLPGYEIYSHAYCNKVDIYPVRTLLNSRSYWIFKFSWFNSRLTELIFVTQLTKGWWLPPQIFKMNHRMILIVVPLVSLESLLNIDTKISDRHATVWLLWRHNDMSWKIKKCGFLYKSIGKIEFWLILIGIFCKDMKENGKLYLNIKFESNIS